MAVPLEDAALNGSAAAGAATRAAAIGCAAAGTEYHGIRGLFDLTGRVAVVAGAGSGIGHAIALGLAGAGADVVLLGHRESRDSLARHRSGLAGHRDSLAGHRAGLAGTALAVRALGRDARELVVDLPDCTAVGPACERLLAERQIDILVNNVGVIQRGRPHELRPREWRDIVAGDLDSAFVLAQFLGQPMVRRRSGKIINTASLPPFPGAAHPAAYAASRQGITALTKALATEWAASGVQVNAIVPGYQEASASRLSDLPGSVAGAAVFLAGAASDCVNGQILVVDGIPAE